MNPLVRGDSNVALVQAAQMAAAQRADLAAKESKVKNMAQIEAAAKDFEANFLSEMLKPMFEKVNEPDPLFGGGKGEEVFNGMMVQEYGKLMADRGGLGLADYVKAALIQAQEAQGNARRDTAANGKTTAVNTVTEEETK